MSLFWSPNENLKPDCRLILLNGFASQTVEEMKNKIYAKHMHAKRLVYTEWIFVTKTTQ